MEKERRVTFRMQRVLIKTQISSVNRVGKILSVCSLYINVSFNLSMQDLKRKASSLSSVTRYMTTESLMRWKESWVPNLTKRSRRGERQPMFCLRFSDQRSCGSECFPSSFLFFCLATLKHSFFEFYHKPWYLPCINRYATLLGYCHFKEFLEIKELSQLSCFLLELPLSQV